MIEGACAGGTFGHELFAHKCAANRTDDGWCVRPGAALTPPLSAGHARYGSVKSAFPPNHLKRPRSGVVFLSVADEFDVEISLQSFHAAFLAMAALFYAAEGRFRMRHSEVVNAHHARFERTANLQRARVG